MTDTVDKSTRSRMMRGIRGRNTRPEIAVRSYLHLRGFRFRIHDKSLPGRPDLVLRKYKTVIQVHGCFWHGHAGCANFKWPKTRMRFWQDKIRGNIARDKKTSRMLQDAGWQEIVVWECNIRRADFSALNLLVRRRRRSSR
jgi:DNA mismatch endonuclease (patch repair protein)